MSQPAMALVPQCRPAAEDTENDRRHSEHEAEARNQTKYGADVRPSGVWVAER